MLHCVRHFRSDPLVKFVVAGGARRKDEDKAVHEGIVDRPLEAGFFAERLLLVFRVPDGPLAVAFAEFGAPGAIGTDVFAGNRLAVDGDLRSGYEWREAGTDFEGEGGDVCG